MDSKLIIFILVLIVLWPGCDNKSSYTQPTHTYLNSYSQDTVSQQLNPHRHLRRTGVFQNTSPESWYFDNPDKSSMLNVPGRGRISGIPSAQQSGAPQYDYDMIQGMNI